MSTPENRLAQYRSYSYYHVLVVCDSSDTADTLAKQSSTEKWRHPTGPAHNSDVDLGPYSVKYIKNDASVEGRYIVLIHGATDAAFSITSAKWMSATAAAATISDRNTSVAVEGSIEVSEPKGVVFLDTVVAACLALGIDAASAVFALKTFFIGYSADDQNPVVEINDIEPIRFICYDTTGSFTEQGGTYRMEFVALANGATRLPQYSKSASGVSIKAGTSLEETIKKVETRVRENYNELFDCVSKQVVQAAKQAGANPDDFTNRLARVDYEIIVDDVYKGKEYVVTNQVSTAKSKPGCDDPATLTFPANTGIEDILHRIMQACDRVQQEAAKGVAEGNNHNERIHYEYKILTALKTTQQRGNDSKNPKLNYTVTYKIIRFLRPKDVSLFKVAAEAQLPNVLNTNPTIVEQIKQNLIEFDYLYTGKNIDVLDFDMKVNMGMAYLQIATVANTLKDQLQSIAGSSIHISNYDPSLSRFGESTQLPIFFGTQIKSPMFRNTKNSSRSAQAAYTMSKHASLEVAEATMTIYGNTKLLNTINAATSPNIITATRTQDNSGEANFTDWGEFPSLVKVNIKMPRNNNDIGLLKGSANNNTKNAGPSSRDYTKDFWFTGYYYVYGIEHALENGQFTQTLHMIAIPEKGALQATEGSDNGRSALQLDNVVGSCYESTEVSQQSGTTGSSNQSGSPVPNSPPGQSSTSTATADNLRDIKSVNNRQSLTPSRIQGYDQAKTSVKSAIDLASLHTGVSDVLLSQIAAAESGFDPSAYASSTGALGVFQHTSGTWIKLIRRFPDLELQTLPPSTALAYRSTDSERAALGAAHLIRDVSSSLQDTVAQNIGAVPSKVQLQVGEVYMGYVVAEVFNDESAAVAATVITNGRQGNGNKSLVDVIGQDKFNRLVASRPNLMKGVTTVEQFLTKTGKAMSSVVQDPIPNASAKKQTSTSADKAGSPTSGIQTAAAATTAADKLKTQQDKNSKATTSKSTCNDQAAQQPQDSKSNAQKSTGG